MQMTESDFDNGRAYSWRNAYMRERYVSVGVPMRRTSLRQVLRPFV